MKLATLLSLGLSLGLCGSVLAADAPAKKKEMPNYLTPETAGPDFKIQGEYGDAEAGKAKLGVQVIALSDNKFRAVVFPGGLPGAGWDGNKKDKVEIDGRRDGDKVTFDGKGWKGEISDGSSINLTDDKGSAVTLNKIMRQSPTMGAKAPDGAKVLYAGKDDVGNWNNAHVDERGLLAAGCSSKEKFEDFTLHVEFLLPFRPSARGQERGNSGVYMQDRYECQVLDSFGLKGENNECGGFYQQFAPSINMCYPPLEWQTYDIDFTAAKFDASGQKTAKATATVRQNGVVIQDHVELAHPTPGGGLSGKDNATPGPIQLQGHGNPVFYRNIWIVTK
jgi:hypothetical protein